MTKKKNLKFKVGDRVRIVSTPTYGPKSNQTETANGAKVGQLYYIVMSYGDGDYDLGTKDTKDYEADTFVGVVHQRHLAAAPKLPLPGEVSWNSNHIHIAPLGVGDIVKLKDYVTHPYFTGESGNRFDKASSRIKPGEEYRVSSITEGKHSIRVRLGLNAPEFTYVASVDADQIVRIRTASQEQMRRALQTAAAKIREVYGVPKPEPKPLEERRKPAKIKVYRTIPDNGLWVEHDVWTGQLLGVVERLTVGGVDDYWVVWGDGKAPARPSLKLTTGTDRVLVDGQAYAFGFAEEKTHHPT